MADHPPHERVDHSATTPDEREQVIVELTRRISALHAEMLRVIAAADDAQDHEADGALSMADWLAYRNRLPVAVARQVVKAAHVLEEMPAVRAVYADGMASFEQVTQAIRFAEPKDDTTLAALLPALSFAEVEAMAKRRRRVRHHERDEARRQAHLRFRADTSGLGSRVSGFLPTEDAAIVEEALRRRAEAAGPDPLTGLWSPFEHRAAEGLRDLCAEDLAGAAAASSEPDASVVVVHVPASSVGRHEPSAEGSATISGDPIDNDALHRILCDTRIEFHVDEPGGRTVGIGRASRTPPRWLRRRVLGREHGCCRWPGCHRPVRHLHHMQHWTRDGPTNASNLMGVCWHHHHLLHEGGWHATGNADDEILLTGPDGRTLRSRAGPIAA
jgi:hypothetical protein